MSVDPSGRQIDLHMGVERALAGGGDLQLQAVGISNENNQSNSPFNLGFLASWRSKF